MTLRGGQSGGRRGRLPVHLQLRRAGNVTQIVDPLKIRRRIRTTHRPINIASMTDPRGNGIAYRYDSHGNLVSIIYEDGTHEDMTYDVARRRSHSN